MAQDNTRLWLIAGGVLVFLNVGDKILQYLNLKDTAEEAAAEKLANQNSTSISSPFNPNYYKDLIKRYGPVLVHKESVDQSLVAKIKNAVTGWMILDDDEQAIYGVFRYCKTKAHVSRLSEIYLKTTGKDLFGWLSRELSASELATVSNIVNNLPNYIKA